MRLLALIFLVSIIASTTSCEKSPAPKFKPCDKVKTIMGAEGVVALRTRFFIDDVYYLRLAGPDPEVAAMYPKWWAVKQSYHYSGPYDAADLRLVSP
jgi:hypothetical protein